MSKYEHIPIELRDLVQLYDIGKYMDGAISRELLRAREQGTDPWHCSRLYLDHVISVHDYSTVNEACKKARVASIMAHNRRA